MSQLISCSQRAGCLEGLARGIANLSRRCGIEWSLTLKLTLLTQHGHSPAHGYKLAARWPSG
jgi:hypothetical protein